MEGSFSDCRISVNRTGNRTIVFEAPDVQSNRYCDCLFGVFADSVALFAWLKLSGVMSWSSWAGWSGVIESAPSLVVLEHWPIRRALFVVPPTARFLPDLFLMERGASLLSSFFLMMIIYFSFYIPRFDDARPFFLTRTSFHLFRYCQ